jgi:hypothetical protein
MLEVVGVNYLRASIGSPPFSADHPPPVVHPFAEMVSEPLAPPSELKWMWMAVPPTRTVAVPALVFSLPPAVALAPAATLTLVVVPAPAVHAVVVDRGSRKRRRSPSRHRWSPRRPSPPQKDR